MGALIVCVLAIGAGAALGAGLGSRSTRRLAGGTRERIARSTVVLLLCSAGALIAAQLDLLVRSLETDAGARSAGLGNLAGPFNALAVSETLHGVLLYAGSLVGLATIVGLLATREARAQRP
jgi:hypothetical protein